MTHEHTTSHAISSGDISGSPGLLFLCSLIGHWLFAWFDHAEEARAHGQALEIGSYVVKTAEATLENWQSELQKLLWQVAGLMFLFAVGSPQSREDSAGGQRA